MHEIKADFIKNRLYIIFSESDRTEMNVYVDKIEQVCKKLLPGFTCIAVFPRNEAPKQKELDLLFNTEDLIYAYGAKKIVRVKKSGRPLARFRKIWLKIQSNIEVEDVTTVQEAEKILDSLSKKNSIQKKWD